MSSEQRLDWQDVVDLQPKGYLETQNLRTGKTVCGPIDTIFIDEMNFVHIKLIWAAEMEMVGRPNYGFWKNSLKDMEIIFSNLKQPFSFEYVPGKGRVIRYAGLNILHLELVEGVDPSRVEGLLSNLT